MSFLEKIEYYFFYFISIIFHPLLMPSLVFVFLFYNKNSFIYSFINYNIALNTLFMLFIFSVVIPLILILFMKLLKVIASITTPAKGERILMSIIVGIFIFELYLFYSKLYPFNVLFKRYILIILLLIIFTTISKFSYHSYSAGAMLSLLLLYYFSSFSKYLYNTNMAVLLSLFLISGLILTSRLVTKAHSFSQVIRGFIMGVISSFITFVIF